MRGISTRSAFKLSGLPVLSSFLLSGSESCTRSVFRHNTIATARLRRTGRSTFFSMSWLTDKEPRNYLGADGVVVTQGHRQAQRYLPVGES